MDRPRREIEIKLRFESAGDVRRSLSELGAREVTPRHFEDNVVFDRDHEPLAGMGRLLRLRRCSGTARVTYKAPVPGRHRHKVRQEEETTVADPGALEHILAGLGFHPVYRYQKYRTLFELGELQLCLDETPLGCFLELEGPPAAIDRAARLLGAGEDRYVVETYRDLHEAAAREAGVEPGDLVFDEESGGKRP